MESPAFIRDNQEKEKIDSLNLQDREDSDYSDSLSLLRPISVAETD